MWRRGMMEWSRRGGVVDVGELILGYGSGCRSSPGDCLTRSSARGDGQSLRFALHNSNTTTCACAGHQNTLHLIPSLSSRPDHFGRHGDGIAVVAAPRKRQSRPHNK